jgi:hypothetical protein
MSRISVHTTLAELERRTIWTLRDEREPVLDGLVAEFAFARVANVNAAQLHSRYGAHSPLESLLSFLLELAPLADAL